MAFVGKDAVDEEGDLRVEDFFEFGWFPFFEDVAVGVFDFEDASEFGFFAAAGEGGVGGDHFGEWDFAGTEGERIAVIV